MNTSTASSFNTTTALQTLGVTNETLTAKEKESLDQLGYLELPGILSMPEIEAIRMRLSELLAIEKENAGKEVHQEAGTARLSNLVDKGDCFKILYSHPKVLAAIAHVLKYDMKLSSVNSRAALPGQGMQGLHADWGGKSVEDGDYQVCNSIWLLDDFTKDNGATRMVAGTHRSGKMPKDEMINPSAPHPDEQLLLAPAGTVVVFNSHTWHGGTLNRTSSPRRSIHSYWTRREQPQQLDQRKFLSAENKARFSPAHRYLFDIEDEA